MRPRISKREALFILDTLKREKDVVEEKLERSANLDTKKLNGYFQAYECLIGKFELLANGKKRGRYSANVDLAEICLAMLGY